MPPRWSSALNKAFGIQARPRGMMDAAAKCFYCDKVIIAGRELKTGLPSTRGIITLVHGVHPGA